MGSYCNCKVEDILSLKKLLLSKFDTSASEPFDWRDNTINTFPSGVVLGVALMENC